MLSVKQGGIKYYFWSLWYDWTLANIQPSGKHEFQRTIYCYFTTLKVGAGKMQGAEEMSFSQTVVFFRIKRVKVLTPTLLTKNCFPLPVGSVSPLLLWWDRLLYPPPAQKFFRIFETIPQYSRNRKCIVICCFYVLLLREDSCLFWVTGSFRLTVKTGANMTASWCITPSPSLLCGWRWSNNKGVPFRCY